MPFLRRYLLLFLLLFLATILLPFAGPWLQRSDRLQKSDAVLMLMGSIGDRVLGVDDLWRKQMADQIFLAEERNSNLGLLRARGVRVIGTTAQVVSYFHQLGVPDSSLVVIPGGAISTRMEAQMVYGYLLQKYQGRSAPFRLIIVSSSSHTRRASMIFRRTLRPLPFPVEVLVVPSKYSNQLTHDWFLHREQIQMVLSEYAKLTAWLLIERWKVQVGVGDGIGFGIGDGIGIGIGIGFGWGQQAYERSFQMKNFDFDFDWETDSRKFFLQKKSLRNQRGSEQSAFF